MFSRSPVLVLVIAATLDADAIARHGGWIAKDWQKRLPHNASPYTSTIISVEGRTCI